MMIMTHDGRLGSRLMIVDDDWHGSIRMMMTICCDHEENLTKIDYKNCDIDNYDVDPAREHN